MKFVIIQVLPFLNNAKDLDPSYEMDLDIWDCFGMKKPVLQPKKYSNAKTFPDHINESKLTLFFETLKMEKDNKQTRWVRFKACEYHVLHGCKNKGNRISTMCNNFNISCAVNKLSTVNPSL